jgi:hypothetical protein
LTCASGLVSFSGLVTVGTKAQAPAAGASNLGAALLIGGGIVATAVGMNLQLFGGAKNAEEKKWGAHVSHGGAPVNTYKQGWAQTRLNRGDAVTRRSENKMHSIV